ncbi:bile acid:sodium symporter [Desulfosoma sp.]
MGAVHRRISLERFLRHHGFVAGLVLVSALAVLDGAETTVRWGRWLKGHGGPEILVWVIFFFSGLALDRRSLTRGFLDLRALAGAWSVIFVFAPLWAFVLTLWPMPTGLVVGLFLVACMPTTLSSGVVMTAAAGGNVATALLITMTTNAAAVAATPLLLEWLMGMAVDNVTVLLDKAALMGSLALLVVLPLALGLAMRRPWAALCRRIPCPSPPSVNTVLVIAIVWIAVCASRTTIVQGLAGMPRVMALAVIFHGGLLALAFGVAWALGLSMGRREPVIFMGAQKTLPLSVLIQTAVFPQYGDALVFCVSHHLLHLIMDGWVLSLWNGARRPTLQEGERFHEDSRVG